VAGSDLSAVMKNPGDGECFHLGSRYCHHSGSSNGPLVVPTRFPIIAIIRVPVVIPPVVSSLVPIDIIRVSPLRAMTHRIFSIVF